MRKVKTKIFWLAVLSLTIPYTAHAQYTKLFFPFVFVNSAPWDVGLTISVMEDINIADVTLTLTLQDITGAVYTYVKSDMDSHTWTFTLGGIIGNFSGTPADGQCSLTVEADFDIDGYHFMTNGTFGAATLPRKNTVADCNTIIFPFVFYNSAPWDVGLVITLVDRDVSYADVTLTLTYKDNTGAVYTYVKSDMDTPVWVFMLNSIISNFSGTPADGQAALTVSATHSVTGSNLNIDGYQFISNGTFGAGTLPRLVGVADITGNQKIGLEDAISTLKILTGTE